MRYLSVSKEGSTTDFIGLAKSIGDPNHRFLFGLVYGKLSTGDPFKGTQQITVVSRLPEKAHCGQSPKSPALPIFHLDKHISAVRSVVRKYFGGA